MEMPNFPDFSSAGRMNTRLGGSVNQVDNPGRAFSYTSPVVVSRYMCAAKRSNAMNKPAGKT
jgi:hypothetical protein